MRDDAKEACLRTPGFKFNEDNCKCKKIRTPPAPEEVCGPAMRKIAAEDCAKQNGQFNSETCKCTPRENPPAPVCEGEMRERASKKCIREDGEFNPETCECKEKENPTQTDAPTEVTDGNLLIFRS